MKYAVIFAFEKSYSIFMKLELVIVDDSPLWLSLAEKLASAHPLVGGVLTFEDSYDAWIHIQIAKPQVVMADIEMPGMNGFFLFRDVRKSLTVHI
ncbi:response regulator [Winogradskyella maritima]|nr:response regulator [Winogradskyella maritima]